MSFQYTQKYSYKHKSPSRRIPAFRSRPGKNPNRSSRMVLLLTILTIAYYKVHLFSILHPEILHPNFCDNFVNSDETRLLPRRTRRGAPWPRAFGCRRSVRDMRRYPPGGPTSGESFQSITSKARGGPDNRASGAPSPHETPPDGSDAESVHIHAAPHIRALRGVSPSVVCSG